MVFSKAAQGKQERKGIDRHELEAIEEKEFKEWMEEQAGDGVER